MPSKNNKTKNESDSIKPVNWWIKPNRNNFLIINAVLSFLGFVDATFLTIIHYKHINPPCTITHGCEKVLSSSLAVIFGIPLSTFGSVYFILLIILCTFLLQKHQAILIELLLIMISLGLLAGIILLFIQFVVLNALCQYCLLVEGILFLQFALSVKYKRVKS